MTRDEINEAIARACGWKSKRPFGAPYGVLVWYDQHGTCWCGVKDYANDLNAMRVAVSGLSDADFHRYTLAQGDLSWRLFPHQTDNAQYMQRLRVAFSATAIQSAEAFLRSLNLWKD